ncbi:hypothetical protein GSI_05164 [Ganoderma sinense ZZ0214-1]|uniref:Fungal-type protein kinase domain-containing protein n=1 Tax=Ganoderma sinense ZZ0214-1 TaxID=1077348 RepID=A0A2G8SFC1_9APHY|nr:hypothetical protein GSI_05164 [Ganoderma sinense ZZ0214-1]
MSVRVRNGNLASEGEQTPLHCRWFATFFTIDDLREQRLFWICLARVRLGASLQATDAAPAPSSSETPASEAREGGTTSADEEDAEEREWNAMQSQKPAELDEPTDEERKKARQVQVHKHMIKVLQLAYDDPGWAQQDRDPVGDRVPQEWRSTRQPIPPSVSGTRPPAADERGGKPPTHPAGVEKAKKSSAKRLDASEFLDELLSCPGGPSCDISTTNAFSKLENADGLSEGEMASRFIDAVSAAKISLISSISRYERPSESLGGRMATVDAAVFRGSSLGQGGTPVWFDQLVPIEFKGYSEGIDPFDPTIYEDTYGEIALGCKRLLERIGATVELLFAAQHRVAVFTLLVIGRRFRMLCWDPAGVIVSPSIDYYDHSDVLYDFLWRVSVLDDLSLGFDPSATRIPPSCLDHLRMDIAALRDPTDIDHDKCDLAGDEPEDPVVFAYVRSAFRASLESDWPRYKLRVPSEDGTRDYLVGKPMFGASGALGRGTRGYVAYDCNTRRFVWLKDAWRASYMATDSEGDVLAKLNAANVENVPTLVCHGDIRDQTTISRDWWERKYALSCTLSCSTPPASTASSHTLAPAGSPGSKKRKRSEAVAEISPAPRCDAHWGMQNSTLHLECPLRQHKHYHIVEEEVCLPLKDFVNGRQLVSLLLDCLRAHHQAATSPAIHILHRDISSGNILIYPKIRHNENTKKCSIVWTGLLTDWELSRSVDNVQTPSKTSQADRVGTYQFMSVNLLSNLSKAVRVSDELELFFHVLVYFAARFLRSNCDDSDTFVDGYFNHYEGPGRMHTCGQKSVVMESTGVLRTQFPYGRLLFTDPMDALLDVILQRFRARYKVLQHAARQLAPPEHEHRPSPLSNIHASSAARAPSRSCASGDSDDSVDSDDDSDDDPDDYGWAALRSESEAEERPTAEDEALAAEVCEHQFMLNIFAKALRHPRWRKDDRRPAPAPASASPGHAIAITRAQSPGSSQHAAECHLQATRTPGSKRRRTTGPERTGRGNASLPLPLRLHPSTRRTRGAVSPRTLPVQIPRQPA